MVTNRQLRTLIPLIIIIFGFASRFILIGRGYNYDFSSYSIVLGIMEEGGNVYSSTTRYNYGPIWFHTLNSIFNLAQKDFFTFRILLVALLSLVDFMIFLILHKRLGRTIAFYFFLNPISIIITGYHNQFDNLALLLGMISVLMIGDDHEQSLDITKISGLFILGLSIATKHILFAFPIWLALKQKGFISKMLIILVPSMLFIFSFLPYWKEGNQGIIQNVFLYKSFNNAFLYQLLIPVNVGPISSSSFIWLLALILFGYIFRKKNTFDSLFLYTAILLITSPAVANQYLAIVMPFVASSLNPFTLSFVVLGSIYLFLDFDGLHAIKILSEVVHHYNFFIYFVLLLLLALGFIKGVWGAQLQKIFAVISQKLAKK